MAKQIKVFSDSTADDSDKTVTPTAGNYWFIDAIRLEYTATATPGSRTVEVRYLDSSGDVIWATEITTDFVASDVMVVNFSPGATTVAPVDNADEGAQHCAAVLPPDGSIRVIDTAAVDAAADDMVIHVLAHTE